MKAKLPPSSPRKHIEKLRKYNPTLATRVRIKKKCLIWVGSVDGDGHPQFSFAHRKTAKERPFFWDFFRKGKKATVRIKMLCQDRACVNPDHMWRPPRYIPSGIKPVGSNNGRAILRESQVKKMRQLYKSKGVSYSQLARQFGISSVQVGHIIRRQSWKSVK